MAVFSMAGGNPALPTYPLQRSVRLRSSASAYFSKSTFPVSSPGTKFTMSFWMKVGTVAPIGNILAYVQTTGNGYQAGIGFANQANGQLAFWQYNGTNGYLMQKVPSMFFRDPSSWYHVVVIYDTTNATAEDRAQIWVNGVRVTAWAVNTQPALNSVSYFASNSVSPFAPYLGAENRNNSGIANPFDGYLEEINFIDGQALTPSSFGAYNSYGVWSPAKYTGTYGTNGFCLNFQDNSSVTTTANIGIGADSSGNGNYWTSNNISITAGTTYDSMLDVPTNTSPTNANYPVWNPLQKGATAINTTATLSQANLLATGGAINTTWSATSTFCLPQSGKWYFECEMSPTVYGNGQFGLRSLSNSAVNCFYAIGVGAYKNNTLSYSYTSYNTGSTNKIGIAYDADNNLYWQTDINGNWLNSKVPGVDTTGLVSGLTAINDYVIGWAYNSGAETNLYCYVNFGQRPFSYTPPTGFKSLNTFNLPDSIVPVGAQYMAATIWTGDGTSPRSFTNTVNGFSMQPDFVWVKSRNAGVSHSLNDSVRGFGTARNLQSNTTGVEGSGGINGAVSAVSTNGFTVAAGSTDTANVNNNTVTYVGWQWRASNASAVTNTSGSITSQVSANQTAGFSIVTFTCPASGNFTVGHGLGVVPAMFILKTRNGVDGWYVYHKNLTTPASNYLVLNTAAATATSTGIWGNTNPTSSVLTLGTNSGIGANLNGLLYCFAAVPGYSAFGSYTGNGSADGPFVFTNFRPRWVLIKSSTVATNWYLLDSSRTTYNESKQYLYPNLSDAEYTDTYGVDFLSNGFKVRGPAGYGTNNSGQTYIYAAFAENPFKNALAR